LTRLSYSFYLGFVLLFAVATGRVAAEAEEEEEEAQVGTNVTINGLNSITDAEARSHIRSQLRHIDKNGVSTARADDAAYFLQLELRKRGYEKAEVDWRLPAADRIVLDVEEGEIFDLAEIISEGNEALSDEAIYELMTTETRDHFGLNLKDRLPYVVDDIETGRDQVAEYYTLLGRSDAEVTLLDPVFTSASADKRATVRLRIVEGKVYRNGAIDLGMPPDPSLAEKFAQLKAEYADQIFVPSVSLQIQTRLKRIATAAGYFEAQVEVTAGEPSDQGEVVRVNFSTEANYGRQFRLNAVKLSGNEKVKDRYFQRMFADQIGETFDPAATNEVISEMLSSGAFRRVTGRAVVADREQGLLDFVGEVEEADRRELGLFGGYGTYEGPIVGFSFRHLNMLGLVHRFDATIEASLRGYTGDVIYTDPHFLWSDWRATASIFSRNRYNEGYSKLEGGLRFELSRRFYDIHSLTFFAQGGYTTITDADIVRPFLGREDYLDDFVGISYELAKLDDRASPTKGYFFQISSSIASTALGGAFDYSRSFLKLNYYLPFGPTKLRFGARSGAAIPFGGGDDEVLPIDLRFFNGGSRSVRSFTERDLGPKDPGGYPVGGEFFTTFNVEYEIPLVGPLSLAMFTDAGNLIYEYSNPSLDNMHYAAGAGLRLNSPLGPLRVDYGHNMNQGEGEPSGTIHVGFGIAF
jgi:outer membrane protein assembly complex protein YaeT